MHASGPKKPTTSAREMVGMQVILETEGENRAMKAQWVFVFGHGEEIRELDGGTPSARTKVDMRWDSRASSTRGRAYLYRMRA